jgi:hypothetical protein
VKSEPTRSETPRPPIKIGVDMGRLVGEHHVILDEIGWFPVSWLESDEPFGGYMALRYSFDPPLSEEERLSRDFAWKVWVLAVTDDVGTPYDSSTGGLGPTGGDREIHPAAAAGAKKLTLRVGTPDVRPDGRIEESQAVANVEVDLATGEVRVLKAA